MLFESMFVFISRRSEIFDMTVKANCCCVSGLHEDLPGRGASSPQVHAAGPFSCLTNSSVCWTVCIMTSYLQQQLNQLHQWSFNQSEHCLTSWVRTDLLFFNAKTFLMFISPQMFFLSVCDAFRLSWFDIILFKVYVTLCTLWQMSIKTRWDRYNVSLTAATVAAGIHYKMMVKASNLV